MHSLHRHWLLALSAIIASSAAQAASITVNTAADDFGSVGSNCSLREAIETANNNADFGGCAHTGIFGAAITDVVTLPAITVTLTRTGTDDSNNSGDLDIDGPLRIDGVDDTSSVIRGDTSDPDSDRHRLVHVISGSVTLNDLTLRDGLEDGSTAGGGLRSEPGSATTLNRVTVTANTADGNAGGILNRGTMTLNDALISNNQTREALNGGGGIFNSPNAVLNINDSRILNNTAASSNGSGADGGGIYSAENASLTLDNSVVDGNVADARGLLDDLGAAGGGIRAAGVLSVVQSSITDNHVFGEDAQGGGIFATGLTSGFIDRSVISFNEVVQTEISSQGGVLGGGISSDAGSERITIQDSVVSGNRAESNESALGGGLRGAFRIVRSTIANNVATGNGTGDGGGIYTDGATVVVNSTLIGNSATRNGGAMFFSSGASLIARVLSSTIVANTSGGFGGGIRINLGNFIITNSVVAGNAASSGGPDCSGSFISQGFNLVQTATNCGMAALSSDQLDVGAGLAAAGGNGGPVAGSSLGTISGMTTRAPLPTSLLIDAANGGSCTDETNAILPTDQVGRNRAVDGDGDSDARCDIGAVEYSDALFENGFE